MFARLRSAVGRLLGLGAAAPEPPSATPPRPTTVEMPTPGGEHRRRRPTRSRADRLEESAGYRLRRDMSAGSASTLKKAMRARRIENGTRGWDSMGARG